MDWAGATILLYDREGGATQEGHLFVAMLGASSYTYAEVTADEQMEHWLGAHIRAYESYTAC